MHKWSAHDGHITKKLLTLSQQAWIKEEGNDVARSAMTDCVNLLRKNIEEKYINFLRHFGPALTGVKIWNADKTIKPVSELLTNSDEAFIHLFLVNYSATWKA